MRRKSVFTALSLAALLTLSSVPSARAAAHAVGQEFIPPESWSYPALDRFEALGLVALPSRGPFTRPDIADFADAIRAAVDSSGAELSGWDRYNLGRLEREFASEAALVAPKSRYDPPVLYVEEAPLYVEADVDLAVAPEKPAFDERWWVFGRSNLSAKIHVGEWLTYDVRYRLTYTRERDEWTHKNKPSPRERSWNGVAALYERAYLVLRWKPVVLFWGREYEDWGPSEGGNLLVSRSAGSLDNIGARLTFRNFRLDTFHSYLSVIDPRRTLSAHRLEFDAWRFTLGLSETALYTGRGIDPLYLLPLSAFYSNQYNERGDDNILWSIDAKCRAAAGLLLYGSLLIDDFQFEDRGGAPDKLAFDLGTRVALGGPLPMTVRLKYRRVGIYTYTHRDTLKYHVTGGGDPLEGDPTLGAADGPDADAVDLRLDYFPRPGVTTSAFVSYRRRGEGNDYRRHTPQLDPTPPFPSGVVEKTTAVGLALLWELDGNSAAGVDLEYDAVDNRDHVSGRDEDSAAIRAFLRWDF